MPYCIYCGKLNAEGGKFCTSCGKPLEPVPVRDTVDPEAPTSEPAPEAEPSHAAVAEAGAETEPAGQPEEAAASDPAPSGPQDKTVQMPASMPAAAPEPQAPQHDAGAAPDPLEFHPDPASAYSAPAAAPGTTQRIQVPAPASAPAGAQANQPESKKTNGLLIGIIIFLVAVIIALVVIFGVKPFDGGSQAEPTKAEQSASTKKKSEIKEPEVEGDPNNPDDDGTANKAKADTAEQNVYSELNDYYGKLSSYDQQVRDAASAFNSDYLKSDMSSRRSTAAAAEALEEELDDLKDEVEDLDVPVSSQNYTSWKSIVTLYDDLCHRIEVICDAWEISLEYSDPTAHQDEIVAPLARDNVAGTNDNKYRLDYEDRYADAAPSEVK